jgi:hypothetical protein
MAVAVRKYTLEDFAEIAQAGFKYSISSATHDIIHALAREVGAPDYVRTPVFSSNREKPRHSNRNRRRVQEISDEDWEGIRTFQSREKQEVSETEKLVRSLRDAMNRVTQRESIVDTIVEFLEDHVQQAIILNSSDELMATFFGTLVTNPLNVRLYATALTRMLSDLDIVSSTVGIVISEHIRKFIREWRDSFDNIVEVNEDEDFDLFCDTNKQNDLRLCKSKFLAHFYNEEYKENDSMIRVRSTLEEATSTLVQKFREQLLATNRIYQAEQIGSSVIEMLCVVELISDIYDDVETSSEMDIIQHVIHEGRKGYPSLSNKLLFRLMDYNTLL